MIGLYLHPLPKTCQHRYEGKVSISDLVAQSLHVSRGAGTMIDPRLTPGNVALRMLCY